MRFLTAWFLCRFGQAIEAGPLRWADRTHSLLLRLFNWCITKSNELDVDNRIWEDVDAGPDQ